MRNHFSRTFVALLCMNLWVASSICTAAPAGNPFPSSPLDYAMRTLSDLMIKAPNALFPGRCNSKTDPNPATLKRYRVRTAMRITSKPAASIYLWIIDPASKKLAAKPKGTILLLHGLGGSRLQMIHHAKRLTAAGYRCILVDLRGQGRSSGKFLTYGVRESADLTCVMNTLETQKLLAQPVGVLGFSYGAATAIQLAGDDPRIKAVVAISPFCSLHEVVKSYRTMLLPKPLQKLLPEAKVPAVVAMAGKKAQFDPNVASAQSAAAKTKAAILLLHGTADRRIPIAHSRNILQAAGSQKPCKLIELKRCTHLSFTSQAAMTIRTESLQWFQTHLKKAPAKQAAYRQADQAFCGEFQLCQANSDEKKAASADSDLDYWLKQSEKEPATQKPTDTKNEGHIRRPAINKQPFDAGEFRRNDALPGVIELSDGRQLAGGVHTTRDKPWVVWIAKKKRWRRIPPLAVLSITAVVDEERLEKHWRWKGMGEPEKVYTGKTYPFRRFRWKLHLADDSELVGSIKGQPVWVESSDKTHGPFVLHERAKGQVGQSLKQLVYVKKIVISRTMMTVVQTDQKAK